MNNLTQFFEGLEDEESQGDVSRFEKPPTADKFERALLLAIDDLQQRIPAFQDCDIDIESGKASIPMPKYAVELQTVGIESNYMQDYNDSNQLIGKVLTKVPVVPKVIGREFKFNCNHYDKRNYGSGLFPAGTRSRNISIVELYSKASANYGRGSMPLLVIRYAVNVSKGTANIAFMTSWDKRVTSLPWFIETPPMHF